MASPDRLVRSLVVAAALTVGGAACGLSAAAPERAGSSETTRGPVDGGTTTPTTTEPTGTTASTAPSGTGRPSTSGADPAPDPSQLPPGFDASEVIETVEEAEALLAATADDVVPPDSLGDAIDAVLGGLIAGELTDEEFFLQAELVSPFGVDSQYYLICNVGELGQFCVTTAADYLDWVDDCLAGDGAHFERLVDQPSGWAGTGVCVRQQERPQLEAGSIPRPAPDDRGDRL